MMGVPMEGFQGCFVKALKRRGFLNYGSTIGPLS